ncbi:MAG TPA: hypothetical protein VMX36_01745, partial [Sedimentisphaerales bacterium]|nr:hypothetical protein [Sedimentisphaerales bacterium]
GEDDITLSSDSGDLTINTSVTAGGAGDIAYNTTTNGNIVLTGTTTAAADNVTMNSIGSINGAGLVTVAVVDLNAATGIGNTTALELAAGTITADNATSGNIDIDNTLAGAVTVNTLTTSGGGTILFENTGAGGVSFSTVSTTTDGSPSEVEDDITLSSDSGDLTINTSVTAGGTGDIAYNTTTNGNIVLTGTTTAAADNVTMNSISSINGTGLVTAAVVGMTSNTDLNMSNYNVANPGSTDLSLSSTGGTVTVVNSAADNWNSISAAAKYNVVLSGDGDITTGDLESQFAGSGVRIFTETGSGGSLIAQGTINSVGYVEVDVEGTASFDDTVTAGGNIEIESGYSDITLKGNLTASNGGVSLVTDNGSVYTPNLLDPAARVLDVSISGYSAPGVGVDFDPAKPGVGKAAIVIRTKEDLILGSSAILTAEGSYSPTNDDRSSVGFNSSPSEGGDPIDVAIYLRSNRVEPGGPNGHVTVNSKVMMGNNGTMVVDAGEKVTFGGAFNQSEFNQTQRLEVVSRKSYDLNEVIVYKRLPYANNPEAIRDWFNQTGGYFAGAYVLRGVKTLLAEVLALTNPVPLVPPRPLEPELRSEVEGPDTEALAKLLSDLGIGVQPYMTEAYADSLSTDLRLYKAAEKLQELMPVLEDVNGIHIAGLRETVAEYFPTLDVLSDERMDSFAQVLASHKGDETNYDLAGQCIFALTEYINILGTDIGWPVETSVEFVMGRYVPRLTENDEIRIAVIQMHLQKEL